jgi:hypothetical protein
LAQLAPQFLHGCDLPTVVDLLHVVPSTPREDPEKCEDPEVFVGVFIYSRMCLFFKRNNSLL